MPSGLLQARPAPCAQTLSATEIAHGQCLTLQLHKLSKETRFIL